MTADVSPTELGTWVLCATVVANLFFGWRKDRRDTDRAKRSELAALEERVRLDLQVLRQDVRDLRISGQEDGRFLYNQFAGATNGVARHEGLMMRIERQINDLSQPAPTANHPETPDHSEHSA